jgi:hypothetical protein
MNLADDEATALLNELVELSGEAPLHALKEALSERIARLRRELEQVRASGKLTREQSDELFGY